MSNFLKKRHKSMSPWIGRLVSYLFVFSGVGLIWLLVRMLRGLWVSKALSLYFEKAEAIEGKGQVDPVNFPLSYYREKLIGLDEFEVASKIIASRAVERVQPDMLRGNYVDLHSFRFGPFSNHQLIIIYDAQGQVIEVQGENLSMIAG